MTKSQLVKKLNNLIHSAAPGLFSDPFWAGKNQVVQACELAGFDLCVMDSKYFHDDAGVPIRKEWWFECTADNDGKEVKATIHITAAGAGTVQDPLGRYDIVAMAF